jgi:bile acid-coenzyme A ligase
VTPAPRFSFTGGSTNRLPIGDLIKHHAAIDPDAALIVLGDRVVTREEFELRCNRRARLLAEHGVRQDDLVMVALPNGLEFYETTMAVWKLGATPAPISTALSDIELRGILDVGKPRLTVGVDTRRAGGHSVLPSIAEVPDSYSAAYVSSLVPRYWKAMTSGGSTGRPKLIVDHMSGEWDPGEGGLAQRPGERVLNPGPLYHNGPFLGTMLALFSGGLVIELGKFDPVQVLEQIEHHSVTWMLLVPTMMHRIARLPVAERTAFDVSSLNTVLHTAAACPAWLKDLWINWLGPDRMLEVYTGTERQAAFTITGQEALEHSGSVGRVQPGSAVRVLDENGEDVAPGEVGELFLRPDGGRGSTYHYLGAEPRARGEWESLGDLGRIDGQGYVYLSD